MAAIPLFPEVGMVGWKWVATGGDGGGALFDSQIPSSTIYLVCPDLPASFSLHDVIQAYGEPSHVLARSYHGPDIGSGIFHDLSIIYLSQGILLVDGDGGKPTLNSATQFSTVKFFVPDEKGLEAAFGGTDPYLTRITPWQGMKDFDFYCRDEAGKPCP
jgi:hypothetical protein